MFEKQDGTKLNATDSKYKATNGQAALFRSLRPDYISVNYNDIALFIPYTEFNLPAGTHNLNIRANVIYSDYSLLQSLTSYPFKYSKK